MPPGRFAGVVSRQTGPTDVRPEGIDCARRKYTDLAHEGCAAVAIAAHPSPLVIDECGRNAIEHGVIFEGESRPLG